jgi:type I restriction enzyme S subunit
MYLGLVDSLAAQGRSCFTCQEFLKPLPPISDTDKLFDLPNEWEWCRFGDIVGSMKNGIYKPAQFYSETRGTPSMRMYNIQDGKLDLSKIARMILTDGEATQYALKSGDLLINRVNSRELVGKTALVDSLKEVTVYEAMNIRIRLIEKGPLPRFVNFVFRTEYVRNFFQKNAKQASGQVSINQPQVASASIPLPPPRRTRCHRCPRRQSHVHY